MKFTPDPSVKSPADMESGFYDLERMSGIVFRALLEINEAAHGGAHLQEEIDQAAMLARFLDEMVGALKSEFMSLHFPGIKAPEH